MSPKLFEIILVIVKFLGIALTGIFGLVGLLFDFRDAQRRLTKWGKVAVSGIFISTAVAAASQALDFTKSAQDTEEANQRSLVLLTEIDRAVDPLDSIGATVWLNVDMSDPKLVPYRDRALAGIHRAISTRGNGEYVLAQGVQVGSQTRDGTIEEVEIPAGSPLYPDKNTERLAFYLLNFIDIEISVAAKGQTTALIGGNGNDLQMGLTTADSQQGLRFVYNLVSHKFGITASDLESDSQYWRNHANILSVSDMYGMEMLVAVEGVVGLGPGNETFNAELSRVRKGLSLQNMVIKFSRGREFWLNKLWQPGPSTRNGYATYILTVPNLARPAG
jgi:hypothetical protein